MYGVTEKHILTTWSLETLTKKVKNGIRFELLKRGVGEENDEISKESTSDIIAQYE